MSYLTPIPCGICEIHKAKKNCVTCHRPICLLCVRYVAYDYSSGYNTTRSHDVEIAKKCVKCFDHNVSPVVQVPDNNVHCCGIL